MCHSSSRNGGESLLREGVNADKIRHRGGEKIAGSYGGMPIHGAESVHKAVIELLRTESLKGTKRAVS